MDPEKFFKEMYYYIWQSHDITKFEKYYAKDFKEIIHSSDEHKIPIELTMDYDDLFKQAQWQKQNYEETTIDIKKLVPSEKNYISVHFYSTSIEKKSKQLRHRCVCGIWHLNKDHKIDRVWAVVTPYYH